MLNMDKVRNKLASFDKTKKGGKKLTQDQQDKVDKIKKYIWKPEPGEQTIRIVPLQDTPDFPFIELKWHYDINGDRVSYLSPATINKPDPIVELAFRLERVRETWLKGRKMQPKIRTYVPIIVRGKEEEGVKFWGFGVQVYEQLTADMTEYDDITDLNNGNDIKVIFKTADEVGKDYPETKITIKPKSRPVLDQDHPKLKEVLELITRKQPKIFDIYTPASYEELVAALEVKLENERRGINSNSESRGVERTVTTTTTAIPVTIEEPDDSVVLPTEEEIEAATTTTTVTVAEVVPSTPPVSPSAQKAKKVNVEDFESAFKDIFPEKKK